MFLKHGLKKYGLKKGIPLKNIILRKHVFEKILKKTRS